LPVETPHFDRLIARTLFFTKLPQLIQQNLSMISFFRKFFRKRSGKGSRLQGTLDLGIRRPDKDMTKAPDADVHQLMIEATRIRKKQGYVAAIGFLKKLAGEYLEAGNTALVTCMNKLIPYMRREPGISWEETHDYLHDIIKQAPLHNAYFRNLHLTMADLLEERNRETALKYITDHLNQEYPDMVDFDLMIKAAEIHIDRMDETEAMHALDQAADLLHPGMERFQHIRKLRKWHRTRALLARLSDTRLGASEYLFHRFMEFTLDMTRVLDPMLIHQFHERKDLYFKKERGFEHTEAFREALKILELEDQQEKLLREIYGFVFEEMPLLLKVTRKQLHFKPGDEETLAEVQEKKRFSHRPFTEMPVLQHHLRHIVDKYC